MKLVFQLFFCVASIHLFGQGANNSPKLYALPGTAAFDTVTSLSRRIALCNIDSSEMCQMSNHALIVTALNYPFLPSMGAFNSPQWGYKSVASYRYGQKLNPIGELTSVNKTTHFRLVGTDLLHYYKTMELESVSMAQTGGSHYFNSPSYFVQIFLATPQVYEQLSEDQQRELLREAIKRYDDAKLEDHYSLVPASAILLMARVLNVNSVHEFITYKNAQSVKVHHLLEDTGVFVDSALYPEVRQMAAKWSGYVASK